MRDRGAVARSGASDQMPAADAAAARIAEVGGVAHRGGLMGFS
jgi:hypothetical protein